MRIASFVVAALLCAVSAQAQDFEAAAKHFGAAQAAFGQQHFHSSAAEFQLAYEITKDPVLLYNIGEAWQKAGEGKKAVASYKAYLKAQPTAQDRADVQKRIHSIEAKKFKIADQSAPGDGPQLAQTTPPPPAPTPPPPKETTLTPDFDAPVASPQPAPVEKLAPPAETAPPPAAAPAETPPAPAAAPAPAVAEKPPGPSGGILEDQPVSRMRVAAWIGVAATVAVLTAGAIFGLSAQARADEISRRETFVDANGQPNTFDAAAQKDYNDLKHDGHLYNDLSIGFFSAAGALAVTTVVLFVVDWKRPSAPKRAWRIEPTVGKDRAAVNLGWSF
jgi:outer membrane biosynthesis protein TonB